MGIRTGYDILVIGHFARDRLVAAGAGESASGGGVLCGGVALRRPGVRVAVLTRLRFGQWPDVAEDLACVTYLTVDRAEADLLAGETHLALAAKKLAAWGPGEVVLTPSSGVTVYAEGTLYQAPFRPRNLSGRTGRGEVCFATYPGKRLTSPPEAACGWAAAVTRLEQEEPGPWRGTPAQVEALLETRKRQA